MAQYEDIKQKINQGLTDRQIAKAVGKRRSKISEIRKGLFEFSDQKKLPEWIDPRDGKIHKTFIFVSCLGYSQLIFAKAYSSMKEIDFLSAHEAMFEYYGGAAEVICPDNTKTAVIKANKYDPDLNEEYNRFTKHYGVTVAPARVDRKN